MASDVILWGHKKGTGTIMKAMECFECGWSISSKHIRRRIASILYIARTSNRVADWNDSNAIF